ncbi:tyrosine-type recombinase/integrase [Microlunatus parietis]|uniref:Integrase n=1 Tax=Microlunatus parietis TaxID=682979 RepID=A0A7Y9IBK9_9ACTN|nr:site-specific integrase [Microlunatus parietis]NYE73581.1 integrase [Microlunatus parietis]
MATSRKRKQRKQREPWGRVRELPSGRHQASYVYEGATHKATSTFDTLLDARAWLTAERSLIDRGLWVPLARRNATGLRTLASYAEAWFAGRELKPRTRRHYRGILDRRIIPDLGDHEMDKVTPADVRAWYATLDPTEKTARAHAYSLLKTIFATAIDEEVITIANPCRIKAAGQSKRQRKIKPASLGELEAIVTALPDKWGLMIMFASWCALRFGELTELRRSDLDLKSGTGVIMVTRGVTWAGSPAEPIVGPPKSDAGVRDVDIPPHLLPMIKAHLKDWAQWGKDGLLFPSPRLGNQLQHGSFYKTWDDARKAAGRPDLRFHDLRHTGAVLAAQSGATLAELMARLGHSTPAMAMRYQHVAEGRGAEIARLLSAKVTGATA